MLTMAMRKPTVQASKSKPRSPRSKRPPLPPSATDEGRFTLLLEEMDHRNRATIEAVYSIRDELGAKIDAHGERIASLEFGMKNVVAALTVLDARVQSHTVMLTEMNAKLDEHSRKLDEHGRKLDEHSAKLDEHGALLGTHGALLADHSARLERIEAKLDRKADKEDLLALEARVSRLEKAAAL